MVSEGCRGSGGSQEIGVRITAVGRRVGRVHKDSSMTWVSHLRAVSKVSVKHIYNERGLCMLTAKWDLHMSCHIVILHRKIYIIFMFS